MHRQSTDVQFFNNMYVVTIYAWIAVLTVDTRLSAHDLDVINCAVCV